MDYFLTTDDRLEKACVGLAALSEALGPAGAIIFMQQFESGSGDYTKEKYNTPDISLDEIAAQIMTTNR
ncbi:hypothetical protein AGMMS49983_04400 [Clostridia bacterium]|nr:hypothetical protein AGMMS49983_04400 [Clostridia bacterium]